MRPHIILSCLVLIPFLSACQLRPRAFPDEATTVRGTPVDIAVLENDSDPRERPISVVYASGSAKGSALINPDGTIRYTPNADAVGEDVFQYRIQNTRGRTSSAEVVVSIVEPERHTATPVPAPATPAQPRTTPRAEAPPVVPPSAPLPVASPNATLNAVAVTIFTREDDKNEGETVQLTIRKGEQVIAQQTLGAEAWVRQTDRTAELNINPGLSLADAAALTLEVRKINSLGAGESWIMQVDVLGRLSDGRTVSLVPKSLPFRFGGGSSNHRTWPFQSVR